MRNGLVSRRAVLMPSKQLVSSGCGIHVSESLWPRHSMSQEGLQVLKTSLDLCRVHSLFPALADEFISKVSSMPRVVIHESAISFIPTSCQNLH